MQLKLHLLSQPVRIIIYNMLITTVTVFGSERCQSVGDVHNRTVPEHILCRLWWRTQAAAATLRTCCFPYAACIDMVLE